MVLKFWRKVRDFRPGVWTLMLCALGIVSASLSPSMPALAKATPAATAVTNPIPVFAYYYIWFDTNSWNRAKMDYPKLGRYTSDDRTVMRQHIQWAKDAGISGFFVSWKSTDVLNRRLGVQWCVAGPSALIGASNFFELAVATAIALFGFQSGAALATVVGVLVEVPVMLSVVQLVRRSRGWYERGVNA